MIALVTSTLIPNDNSYSFFSNEERITQTVHTIHKLLKFNFEAIYIFDNSVTDATLLSIASKFSTNPKIKFYHNRQYSFNNKGLNEALLILNNIDKLPHEKEIFKISARYYPNENLNINDFKNLNTHSFIGKGYGFNKKSGTISTRAYAIKNAKTLEEILLLSIEDMLSYSSKITGFRSFISSIKNYFNQSIAASFQLSIEHSIARILKKNFKYKLIDKLNIEGYVAGAIKEELISE